VAWFGLGALLLLLAVPGRSGKRASVDLIGAAAIATFASAFWWSLSVYPDGRIAPIAVGWAVALALILAFGARNAAPRPTRLALLALGATSILFALFGPADGLF
jgi:apolipoprotein N-acyltransferase